MKQSAVRPHSAHPAVKKTTRPTTITTPTTTPANSGRKCANHNHPPRKSNVPTQPRRQRPASAAVPPTSPPIVIFSTEYDDAEETTSSSEIPNLDLGFTSVESPVPTTVRPLESDLITDWSERNVEEERPVNEEKPDDGQADVTNYGSERQLTKIHKKVDIPGREPPSSEEEVEKTFITEKQEEQVDTDSESSEGKEYDTDLEEDFPPVFAPEKIFDGTGKTVYLARCHVEKVVPSSYAIRNMEQKVFKMSHHYFSSRGAIALADALRSNTFIEQLDLSDNYIRCEGGVAVAHMLLENCFVTVLDLSYNCLQTVSCQQLGAAIGNTTTLKHLSLKANHLTDESGKAIFNALKTNESLQVLDLSENDLTDAIGPSLAEALTANSGLVHLDISWNLINGPRLAPLAKALKLNIGLEILNMARTGLIDAIVPMLFLPLKFNKNLAMLNLSHNRLGIPSLKVFTQVLNRNTSLEVLTLGSNRFSDEGVRLLLKSLNAKNKTLLLLDVQGIRLESAECRNEIEMFNLAGDNRLVLFNDSNVSYSTTASSMKSMFDTFLQSSHISVIDLYLNTTNRSLLKRAKLDTNEVIDLLRRLGLQMTQEKVNNFLKWMGLSGPNMTIRNNLTSSDPNSLAPRKLSDQLVTPEQFQLTAIREQLFLHATVPQMSELLWKGWLYKIYNSSHVVVSHKQTEQIRESKLLRNLNQLKIISGNYAD